MLAFAGGDIEEADVAGVAFAGVDVVVVFEGQAHEDGAEIVGVFGFAGFGVRRFAVFDAPGAGLVVEEGEGEAAGAAIGGDDAFTVGGDCQAPGAGTGLELAAEGGGEAAAGEDGFAAGTLYDLAGTGGGAVVGSVGCGEAKRGCQDSCGKGDPHDGTLFIMIRLTRFL